MKTSSFQLDIPEKRSDTSLIVDGQRIPNETLKQIDLKVTANEPTQLTIHTGFLPGTVKGQAVVRVLERLLGPKPPVAPQSETAVQTFGPHVEPFADVARQAGGESLEQFLRENLYPALLSNPQTTCGGERLPDGRVLTFIYTISALPEGAEPHDPART